MTKNENGNGYNGKFTAQQFIDAMPGTGGVVSLIAAVVGCAWNTAKKYIDEYPTVNRAWRNERSAINDKAQHNIIKSINEGDLQMSKWWLSVLDDEFKPKQAVQHTGTGEDGELVVKFESNIKPDDV